MDAKVGDTIKMGNYSRTSIGEDPNIEWSAQPIRWQVLAKDDNRVLIISRDGIDAKAFDTDSNVWENSDIRTWLNDTFYKTAFNATEQEYIVSTELTTGDVVTTDKVFLLSKSEVEDYFDDNEARRCKATDYAVKNNALVDEHGPNKGYSYWWLRSAVDKGHGHNKSISVKYVSPDGVIHNKVEQEDNIKSTYTVRPAMWVNI